MIELDPRHHDTSREGELAESARALLPGPIRVALTEIEYLMTK